MAKKKTPNQTLKAQNDFLEALCAGATIIAAAKAANVSTSLLYRWRKADKEFATDWSGCYEYGADALEAEAQRRAVEGTVKPVFHQGQKCGSNREYSDTLLMFLLKSRNPYKFCDRARTAQIMRSWAIEDGKGKDDGGTTAAAAAIEALERLATDKAAMARKPN